MRIICIFSFMLQAVLLLNWVHVEVHLDNDCKRCKVVTSVQEQYFLSHYEKENVQHLSYLCLTCLHNTSGNLTCWMKSIQLL